MKINCPIHVSAPLPLCRPKLIQSTPSHATSWWVTSHFCKSSLPFWLSYKDMVCIFQLSHAVLTCTVCLVLLWLDRPLIWSRLRIFFSILFTPQWLRFRFCRNILFAETSLCGFRRVRNIAKSDLASFSLSVQSVRPHGRPRPPLDGFSWCLIFKDYSKICWDISGLVKIW